MPKGWSLIGNPFNFAGQHEWAADHEDALDLHQPVCLANGVGLVFTKKDSDPLKADIRRPSENGHTWEFTCLNAQATETEFYPSRHELLQNFPNPFNPSTQIIYSLPVAAHVELSVYNVHGQRVATLVNEYQDMGSHTVVWNAGDVGTGVYFIKMQAGRFSTVKKYMLIQ